MQAREQGRGRGPVHHCHVCQRRLVGPPECELQTGGGGGGRREAEGKPRSGRRQTTLTREPCLLKRSERPRNVESAWDQGGGRVPGDAGAKGGADAM